MHNYKRVLNGLRCITEKSAEVQQFFLTQKNPNNPQTRVDLTSGSFLLSASQITDFESLNRKEGTTASSALSLSEYLFNQELSIGRAGNSN